MIKQKLWGIIRGEFRMSRQLVLLFSVGEKAARVNAEIVFAIMLPPFVIVSEAPKGDACGTIP